MFVLHSTYLEELKKRLDAEIAFQNINWQYNNLLIKYNTLIEKLNEKGGEDFVEKGSLNHEFNKDDVNRMLLLCHPDKHDGKKSANEITVKLLDLRSRL